MKQEVMPVVNTHPPRVAKVDSASVHDIYETIMDGGYYFTGDYGSDGENVSNASQARTKPASTTATTTTTTTTTNPNTTAPATKLPSISISPTASAGQRGVTPLSSLAGATPTPSHSNAESLRTTPVATQQQQQLQLRGQKTEVPVLPSAATAPSVNALVARLNNCDVSSSSGITPSPKKSSTPTRRGSNSNNNTQAEEEKNARNTAPSHVRPVLQKPPVTAAFAPVRPPTTTTGSSGGKDSKEADVANSSVRSTPPPAKPTVEKPTVSLSASARAGSLPGSAALASDPARGATRATTTRRATVGASPAAVGGAVPPPLSPKKANFAPMQRVNVSPASSMLTADTSRTVTPSRLAAATPKNASATQPHLTPASSGSMPTVAAAQAHPHPPQLTAQALGGVHGRPLPGVSPLHPTANTPIATAATSPKPPMAPSSSSTGSSPKSRARPGVTASPLPPPNPAAPDSTDAPPAEEVPTWLAQVNTALMEHGPSGPSAGQTDLETSQPQLTLAQHRTFSQAVTTSMDDWLNPCSRPKGLSISSGFYSNTNTQASASEPGLPPGVTAAAHGQNVKDEMSSGYTDDDAGRGAGSSQTSLTDTTGTAPSRATPMNANGSGHTLPNDDSASHHTAPFLGARWKSDEGAPVRRQYPSRPASLAGSITSAENAGFVPISKEQRTMTPQSQRLESSGCISLCSNVTDAAAMAAAGAGAGAPSSLSGTAPQRLGGGHAPQSLGRRHGSSSDPSVGGGSGDIMAPVRLGQPSNGASTEAALLFNTTTTLTTEDTPRLGGVAPEPLMMPHMHRRFSLQGQSPPTEELPSNARSSAAALRYAMSTESGIGSASVLSTNEGPSSMRLPLARFMRNASTASAAGVNGRQGQPYPHQQLQQQQQQQQTLANAMMQSPMAGATNPGGPAVLSLYPDMPEREGNGGAYRSPMPMHDALRQNQVQTLDDAADFTMSAQPSDALSTASRATSGISLAAETTFVQCD